MSSARFEAPIYRSRLQRAATETAAAGFAAVVITPGPDLQYFTGSRAVTFERLTALVIPAQGDPVVVAPHMELAALRESAIGELGIDIAEWVDGDDPHALVAQTLSPGNIGVSDSAPALHTVPLGDRIAGDIRLATPVVRALRMVKDDAEIAALAAAGAAIDRVHAQVPSLLAVGRSEREIARDIAERIVAEGHSHPEFIIVGSGPHGADPHHEVSDRVLQAGDVVVVDIGGPVELGYNSDSTRTYALGAVAPEVADNYDALQRAQAAAVAAVQPGVTAGAIDDAARAVLREAGVAEKFVHRTGHGIGLSVHEEPYIVAGNDLQVQPGMAFSVEPGIYFEGQWGARIEDIVVCTADGVQSLNNQPHSLVIVPTKPARRPTWT